ncbi:MAG: hypothetical protein ACE366_17725 [Bradymonadia bacterium]
MTQLNQFMKLRQSRPGAAILIGALVIWGLSVSSAKTSNASEAPEQAVTNVSAAQAGGVLKPR